MNFTPPTLWALAIMPLLCYSQNTGPPIDQALAGKSWQKITSSVPASSEIKLLYSDIETSRFEIIIGGFWQETVRITDGKPEIKAFAGNSSPMLLKGAPDLEKLTVSLAIPDMAGMQVSILEEEFTDLQEIYIIPSKGNLSREFDPDSIPYEYGREYVTDAFFPGVVAELRTPHIIRDVRGQTVVIYPFRYNALKKIFRVYSRLVIELKNTGEHSENKLTGRKEEGKSSSAFDQIYSRNFLNYAQYQNASRYIPVEEDGNMLVISHGPFVSDMQDFVNWKNMSGIPTEIVDVSTIGISSADIKAFVADYYNTHGLTYLLLVGDAAHVPPSSTAAGVSDNDYGYIAGDDHYPDIFTGRFSAQTHAHVVTQVQRTLKYEKEPDTTAGSFGRAMGIASSQGPGDEDEYDWQHERNIRSDYMGFTFNYGAELYDGSQGEQDAAGNPTSAMVAAEINSGIGIISYTGHGSSTSWSTSGFDNTKVKSLTNFDRHPFIFSVACANGDFANYTCFAETWLRATKSGKPTGAVATIMSTINQSWSPPMCGQDEMVDILVESYPENIRRTFGGICMNGCMKMNDVYGIEGDEMTDTWLIFGDPSLAVRTASPVPMNVSHDAELPVGSGQLTVFSDQEGARVAISNDYQLLATGFISGGSADVYFEPLYCADTLTVTVIAFNRIPAIDSVIITEEDMTYVTCNAFQSNYNDVAPGEQNADVIGVKVVMSGSLNPLSLQTLTFNMNGTTSLSDISNALVYYTGNSSAFDTSILFDSTELITDYITFSGSQALNGGDNYFWLAYNLSTSAVTGDYIDAECISLSISDSISVTITPNMKSPAGAREIEVMEMVGINTFQTSRQPAFAGDQAVDLICVEILTDGAPLPLQLISVRISTEGTSDFNDVSNISVYYTSENYFATNTLFGSAYPEDTVIINGTRSLAEGTNYLWIAYDLSSLAVAGNKIDAECLELVFAGGLGAQVPLITDPAGFRIIELDYCIPTYTYGTSYGDYISLVELASLVKSSTASATPYYTVYQDITTHLLLDSTYNLAVSAGTYGTGNTIAAWIDFDHDGIFETGEKLGEVDVPTFPAKASINFSVPADAFTGTVRMRVREVWSITGIDPCINYLYGETEDYVVHLMRPGCWLGFTNQWANPSNWSDGVVPGAASEVTLPEILLGDYYPGDFSDVRVIMDKLIIEEGAILNIPAGVVIFVGTSW